MSKCKKENKSIQRKKKEEKHINVSRNYQLHNSGRIHFGGTGNHPVEQGFVFRAEQSI